MDIAVQIALSVIVCVLSLVSSIVAATTSRRWSKYGEDVQELKQDMARVAETMKHLQQVLVIVDDVREEVHHIDKRITILESKLDRR